MNLLSPRLDDLAGKAAVLLSLLTGIYLGIHVFVAVTK